MSEKDRLDWSDESDFDSLADEPIEGFADFDDIHGYEDSLDGSPDDDAETMSDRAEAKAIAADDGGNADQENKKGNPTPMVPRSRGISSGELGFLFSASILVAAAGIGSASLLTVGVNPASLWQPDQFMAWDNYLNLQNNPLNILVLICLGVVFLTILGSSAVAKAASGANDRAQAAEDMLDRVTTLRLENESDWQDPSFKAYKPAASFVAETLGAWRLQASRQKHFTGLEGELHRLEKALTDGSREDLTGRFDSPAVGALSDEMIRYFDERDTLSRQVEEMRSKDKADACEIAMVVQDARCWHHAAEKNLGLQGTAVERLAERLDRLATNWDEANGDTDSPAAFTAFKAELDNIRTADAKAPDSAAELTELVDKGSKLAFQIAMEVARLGPRGERLVPMSQSLEDLTTSFRTVTEENNSDNNGKQSLAGSLAQLSVKLTDLEQKLQGGDTSAWPEKLRNLGAGATQLAHNLSEMVQSHTPQADRLTNLGANFSEFSGAEFDADDMSSGNPDNPPAGVLSIEGQTPFGDNDEETSIHQPADVDPFSVTPPTRMPEVPGDSSFTSSVGEPKADIFGSGTSQDQAPGLEIESSYGVKQDPFDAGPPAVADPQPAAEEEEVYDLEDFGALPAAEVPETEEEEVYEMSDLAGKPVVDEEEVYEMSDLAGKPVVDEEDVYEIADLGAVRLDSPETDSAEEVYDLNAFGAVPLN